MEEFKVKIFASHCIEA